MASRATNLSMTTIGVAVLVFVGGLVWFGLGAAPPSITGPVDQVTPDIPVAVDLISVHVSGAVAAPGVVDLPSNSRIADAVAAAGGATSVADLGGVNLASTVRDGQHVVVPLLDRTSGSLGGPAKDRLDLNTADAQRLQDLPGVGPVLAARIVSFREDKGPFGAIEDLLDVPGIGESKLAAIRDALEDP